MKRSAANDHYATLQVSRNASPEAVRRAWRKQAQKYHPDRHGDAGDAAARMAQINVAYGVLSDAAARAAYDSSLAAAASTAKASGPVAASLQDKPGWSWALLVAVLSVTLLTLGLVALRTKAPLTAPASVPSAAAQPQRIADTEPLLPAMPVRPWTEPPRRQAVTSAETEPVARLVRDGTLSATPVRPRNGAAAP